jgi:hypothetical protein
MAKKQAAKVADTFEAIRPYLERALRDEEFRNDLKDALSAARELYGPLTKGNGVATSARNLATDKKTQEQLRRALDDFTSAAGTLQGAKKSQKSHKGRKMLMMAGIVAGILYNPWTGPQTREKILDMIAGSDDLEPLETYASPESASPVNGGPSEPAADEPTATGSAKTGARSSKS